MIYQITLKRSDGATHVTGSLSDAEEMLEEGWRFLSMRGMSLPGYATSQAFSEDLARNAALQINA